ncbi:hypothetical protein [Nitratireductor sp. OM-1]|uniref:hypothetical protein n=1 Tax=Nitratireductor sp. OM-1 TaxID=1756988 RepID=UPI000DDC5DE1|nr:hypothetical protein [Nitratireductor sp. OM-1]
MLLTSAAAVREELGFDDMTDINDAVAMALNAAEPQLASALNTSFGRAEVTDTFWVPEPTVVDGPHRKTEFWLSRGFVFGDLTVAGFDVPPDAIKLNRERGVARDWETFYVRAHVALTYTAGFEADETNPKQYKLDQVPSWLQEAARLQALVHLSSAAPITEAGISIDVETCRTQLASLMTDHSRYAPMAIHPL